MEVHVLSNQMINTPCDLPAPHPVGAQCGAVSPGSRAASYMRHIEHPTTDNDTSRQTDQNHVSWSTTVMIC